MHPVPTSSERIELGAWVSESRRPCYLEIMWAPPMSARKQHRRIADYLAADDDDDDAGEDEASGCWRAGTKPPGSCSTSAEQRCYEVMLDVAVDDVVPCGVEPQRQRSSRSHSPAPLRRMHRKLASWLTTPSPGRQLLQVPDGLQAAREARRAQARLDRARSGAAAALDGLRFISSRKTGVSGAAGESSSSSSSKEAEEMWREVEARFRALATTDGMLSREDFAECIGMAESKEFAKHIYDALARRRQHELERITRQQLRDFWLQISDDSFDARLQIFFDMVDTNADGRITRQEVQELIILSASANNLSKLKDQAREYAALIMEELDREQLGYIELWQLEALLLQKELYLNNGMRLNMGRSGNNLSGLASRPKGLLRGLTTSSCCFIMENWKRMWVLLLWLIVTAGLFVWKFLCYRRSPAFHVLGYCLPTAKGAAETLKLNMALILLPVCRNTLTWLRSTTACRIVPFDDNINFHKTIAAAIVVGVMVHATNHLACDFPRLIHATPQAYQPIAVDFGSKKPTFIRLVTGIQGTTGIAMVLLMSVAFTLATSGFRKHGGRLPFPLNKMTGFNTFWYSHHLFVLVYLLLLIHGYFVFLVHEWYARTTWMYLAVPVILYLGERTLRSLRSEAFAVKILKVSVLPGNVLTLLMSKPHGFRYHSGQYIFLKCPSISPFEWHPFSITSAPGDDHLSVHIKTVGDWTQHLRRVFTSLTNSHNATGSAKFSQSELIYHNLPRLLVDGPYGAPAQNYKNYDVLLLVGLGIGATPFISILRDLLNNIKPSDEQESGMDGKTSATTTGSSRNKPLRTTSAYFFWVTREPSSFEWFKGVMDEVAEMDHKRVIEMHNHLTSVYEEGDARTTLLAMIQALNHAKTGVDIVSGTRVRTHFARPSWNEVFSRIARKHPGATVGVFYCGNGMLAKELKKLSHELTHKTRTRFCFHKESL